MDRLAVPEGYEKLAEVLDSALAQSAFGKGKERHANSKPFHEQDIIDIAMKVGTGFPKGQAIKKIVESTKLRQLKGVDAEIHELVGAIVYIAGTIVALEITKTQEKSNALGN